jgi:hypothetical protein
MKRSFVIVIPLLLLMLLNACDSDRLPPLSPKQWAAFELTRQATAMPQNLRIKNLLGKMNNITRLDELEQSIVGKYDVLAVGFPSDYYLEIDMNCECTEGTACCDPRRIFFVTMQRMFQSKDQVLAEVPSTVRTLDVVCFDHKFAFATVYVPWEKVRGFLQGVVSAAELNSSISPQVMP